MKIIMKIFQPIVIMQQNQMQLGLQILLASNYLKVKQFTYFLCLDAFSNRITVFIFRTKPFTTSDIVKKLTEAIEKKNTNPIQTRIDYHTDQGTQFTSQAYIDFIKDQKGLQQLLAYQKLITPKNNLIAERFMLTFKEHKINGRTFQEELFYQIEINSKFKGYRKVFNLYLRKY